MEKDRNGNKTYHKTPPISQTHKSPTLPHHPRKNTSTSKVPISPYRHTVAQTRTPIPNSTRAPLSLPPPIPNFHQGVYKNAHSPPSPLPPTKTSPAAGRDPIAHYASTQILYATYSARETQATQKGEKGGGEERRAERKVSYVIYLLCRHMGHSPLEVSCWIQVRRQC